MPRSARQSGRAAPLRRGALFPHLSLPAAGSAFRLFGLFPCPRERSQGSATCRDHRPSRRKRGKEWHATPRNSNELNQPPSAAGHVGGDRQSGVTGAGPGWGLGWEPGQAREQVRCGMPGSKRMTAAVPAGEAAGGVPPGLRVGAEGVRPPARAGGSAPQARLPAAPRAGALGGPWRACPPPRTGPPQACRPRGTCGRMARPGGQRCARVRWPPRLARRPCVRSQVRPPNGGTLALTASNGGQRRLRIGSCRRRRT